MDASCDVEREHCGRQLRSARVQDGPAKAAKQYAEQARVAGSH